MCAGFESNKSRRRCRSLESKNTNGRVAFWLGNVRQCGATFPASLRNMRYPCTIFSDFVLHPSCTTLTLSACPPSRRAHSLHKRPRRRRRRRIRTTARTSASTLHPVSPFSISRLTTSACRLTGAAAFTGAGGYALYQAHLQGAFAKTRPKGSPVVAGGVSAAIGVGEFNKMSKIRRVADCSHDWSWYRAAVHLASTA